jgi:hypothetical protein
LCGQGFSGRKKKGVFTRKDKGEKIDEGGCQNFQGFGNKGECGS